MSTNRKDKKFILNYIEKMPGKLISEEYIFNEGDYNHIKKHNYDK